MITSRESERGQVVVFLVFVLVVLLGFAALAIDGGMIYADRRLAQTAADAAAMAGVGIAAEKMDSLGVNSSNFWCPSGALVNPVKSAMNAAAAQSIVRAGKNDFVIDTDISDSLGVEVTCHIDDKGSWKDKYVDVRVVLVLDTHTSFAHLFTGKGQIRNTVEAIARVRPRSPLAFGNAIVSMGQGCGNDGVGGIEYDGGGSDKVTVTGGGVYSSSCMTMNGGIDLTTQCDQILYPGCTDRPGIFYTTDYEKKGGSGKVVPTPQPATGQMPLQVVPPPDCNDPDATKHTKTITKDISFAPGLHCLYAGMKITGKNLVRGDGVTIYVVGGDFEIGGGADVNLSAPDRDGVDQDGDGKVDDMNEDLPALRGMLIYMDPSRNGTISLSGNSSSMYTGTIYAPGGTIDVGGNSAALKTVRTQLIGGEVKLHGGVTVDIRFVEEDNYPVLPKMELAQ